jgi:glutathione synthase/RimK-type ligase-like ATP-grasp enzyme
MYRVAIVKNETRLDHLPWIDACKRKQDLLNYTVIDITKDNWLTSVCSGEYDLFLLRPPGRAERFKKLYDERVFILSQVLGKRVYPSSTEIYIYENKGLLRDWMIANAIPHPKSYIFYSKEEAFEFVHSTKRFPVVAKTNMGASGNGVVFLNSRQEFESYVKTAFTRGIKIRSGPNLYKGSILKKIKKVFLNKQFIEQRIDDYKIIAAEAQKGYIFLQEFIPHTYEWRCVRIGESYFAHKKIAKDNRSSGTLLKRYDPVPESLLDFIKVITDNSGIQSTSIDLFERGNDYLVNEIQCFFGQSDPYQLIVNSKPGRYILIENKWCFEEGDFARNACYDLRLEHAISLIS